MRVGRGYRDPCQRRARCQHSDAIEVSASDVHAIHSRCGSTFGDTMPSVNAVISSATNDCAEAAVPRAAGNRSSMRSVSTGKRELRADRREEQQRLLQRDRHGVEHQVQEHAHQRRPRT